MPPCGRTDVIKPPWLFVILAALIDAVFTAGFVEIAIRVPELLRSPLKDSAPEFATLSIAVTPFGICRLLTLVPKEDPIVREPPTALPEFPSNIDWAPFETTWYTANISAGVSIDAALTD